ncbi:MAG: ABC transporter ATP-binding protein [Kiritimatiellae bacterium]|nr:ABC transporter ATP-binding protein [Kiritimatiellia bacterium]
MLEIKDVSKKYGSAVAVNSVSLRIERGEFFCILGPSGCGKTTLLRMIAGFERPSSGRIRLEDTDITDIPPYQRDVNTVFQNYALFPHYSVFDNIAYGLRAKKCPAAEISDRVEQAIALVGLSDLATRMPAQLSGGQQQRVALARALINRPKLLLLDEPLSALDKKISEQMRYELADLQAKTGITFIYVTHNQAEAMTMAHRVVVMNNGCVEQCASPTELYQRPATRFAAEFVGSMNFFDGTIEPMGGDTDTFGILLEGQAHIRRRGQADGKPGRSVVFGIRPEQLRVSLLEPKEYENGLFGQITRHVFMGDATQLQIHLQNGKLIEVKVPNYLLAGDLVMALEANEQVWVIWSQGSGVVLYDV